MLQSIRFSDSLLKNPINQSRETNRFSCTHGKDICMENKEAYQCVLSIIMDETNLDLENRTQKIFLNMKSNCFRNMA